MFGGGKPAAGGADGAEIIIGSNNFTKNIARLSNVSTFPQQYHKVYLYAVSAHRLRLSSSHYLVHVVWNPIIDHRKKIKRHCLPRLIRPD
jgi:hypothetical protein